MGKLSHIDDFDESAQKGEPPAQTDQQRAVEPIYSAPAPESKPQVEPAPQEAAKPQPTQSQQSAAKSAAEFHGLEEGGKAGGPQAIIVVLAVVVCVAAIAYIANYSLHLF